MKPKFIDVNESRRTYYYPNHMRVDIYDVTGIHVSKSGNHRVRTKSTRQLIMSPGWIYIEFHARDWTF